MVKIQLHKDWCWHSQDHSPKMRKNEEEKEQGTARDTVGPLGPTRKNAHISSVIGNC